MPISIMTTHWTTGSSTMNSRFSPENLPTQLHFQKHERINIPHLQTMMNVHWSNNKNPGKNSEVCHNYHNLITLCKKHVRVICISLEQRDIFPYHQLYSPKFFLIDYLFLKECGYQNHLTTHKIILSELSDSFYP